LGFEADRNFHLLTRWRAREFMIIGSQKEMRKYYWEKSLWINVLS